MEMKARRRGRMTLTLTVLAAMVACGVASSGAGAASKIVVHRMWMDAPAAPGTPTDFNLKGSHLRRNLNLNQVGVIKEGRKSAKNVMVIEPGTSAGAAYFVPFAKSLVERLVDWQVWTVERRENLLEDQTELNKAKRGDATPRQLF